MTLGERIKFIISNITLFFVLILISSMLFGPETELNYEEDGIKVEATITSSYGHKTYYGVYKDLNGNLVETEIIPNKIASIGEVVDGYYLAEEPNKVWCKPSDELKTFSKALLWFFEIAIIAYFIFIIWAFVYGNKEERKKNQAIWEEGMKEFNGENTRNDEQIF